MNFFHVCTQQISEIRSEAVYSIVNHFERISSYLKTRIFFGGKYHANPFLRPDTKESNSKSWDCNHQSFKKCTQDYKVFKTNPPDKLMLHSNASNIV